MLKPAYPLEHCLSHFYPRPLTHWCQDQWWTSVAQVVVVCILDDWACRISSAASRWDKSHWLALHKKTNKKERESSQSLLQQYLWFHSFTAVIQSVWGDTIVSFWCVWAFSCFRRAVMKVHAPAFQISIYEISSGCLCWVCPRSNCLWMDNIPYRYLRVCEHLTRG